MKNILFLFLTLTSLLSAQWTSTNGPNNDTSAANVTSIISLDTILIAGTHGNGIFKYSINKWTSLNNGISYMFINNLAVHNNYFYACIAAGKDDSAGIFISTNYGNQWRNISNGIPPSTYGQKFAFTDTQIFVGCYFPEIGYENGPIYRSKNGGQDWEEIFAGIGNMGISALTITNKYIIAGVHETGAFRSKLDTISWNRIDNFSGYRLSSIIRSGEYLLAGTDQGLFYSTDEGENWSQINTNLGFINNLYAYKNYVFAGTWSDGVYKSDDYGQTWNLYNEGLPYPAAEFSVNGNYLYAATSSGVWRRSLSDLTAIGVYDNFNTSYSLSQNYPNPFNPTTVIKYSIPFESNIVFSIYNSLGQKVKEFIEGVKAPGNYEINVNSSGLASGVYFYSLKASSSKGNNFSVVKKMMIIK